MGKCGVTWAMAWDGMRAMGLLEAPALPKGIQGPSVDPGTACARSDAPGDQPGKVHGEREFLRVHRVAHARENRLRHRASHPGEDQSTLLDAGERDVRVPVAASQVD